MSRLPGEGGWGTGPRCQPRLLVVLSPSGPHVGLAQCHKGADGNCLRLVVVSSDNSPPGWSSRKGATDNGDVWTWLGSNKAL